MLNWKICFWLLAWLPAVAAAQFNNDYYKARGSAHLAELLSAVERYHLQPGVNNMQRRNYRGAYGDFVFILNHFPNHPRALLLLGELCDRWKAPHCNPEPFFDKAVEVNPKAGGTHLIKGIYLQKKGRLDEAVASYKAALEYEPDSFNTHYNLGLTYFAQKKYELANEHAQKAYALGVPLPALRQKLTSVGAWKALPEAKRADQSEAGGDRKPESEPKPDAADAPKEAR